MFRDDLYPRERVCCLGIIPVDYYVYAKRNDESAYLPPVVEVTYIYFYFYLDVTILLQSAYGCGSVSDIIL